jgi:hypothetical protein
MAASRDEVFERIREVLAERLSVEESDITEEANFQEDLDPGRGRPADPDGRSGCRVRHLAPVATRRTGLPIASCG